MDTQAENPKNRAEAIKIRYFTVLGERCSGTNLLQVLLSSNFDLEYTDKFHHKHFFGHCDYTKQLELLECTLFVCVARNIYEWLLSFFEKQHHLEPTDSFSHFISREICSIGEDNKEIEHDRDWTTGQRFENMIKLRTAKLRYVIHTLPKLVPHYCFVLYENISTPPLQINFLEKLSDQFKLTCKQTSFHPVYFNAQVYGHTKTKRIFNQKKYYIKEEKDVEFIESQLDPSIEKDAGYDLRFFRHKIDSHGRANYSAANSQAEMIKRRNKSLLDSGNLAKILESDNGRVSSLEIKNPRAVVVENHLPIDFSQRNISPLITGESRVNQNRRLEESLPTDATNRRLVASNTKWGGAGLNPTTKRLNTDTGGQAARKKSLVAMNKK